MGTPPEAITAGPSTGCWVSSGRCSSFWVDISSENVSSFVNAPAGTKSVPAGALTNELTFSEEISTQKLEHRPEETQQPVDGPAVIASGGVPIKELFSLARQQLIVY